MSLIDASQCPLCGGPNNCQLCTTSAYKGHCWCATVNVPDKLLARVPAELRNRACVCRECIEAFNGPASARGTPGRSVSIATRFSKALAGSGNSAALRPGVPRANEILPGESYLDSNGLLVFTAAYHLRRGYCCGSGCRHCPYPTVK